MAIICIFLAFVALSIVIWTLLYGISPMPSSLRAKKVMFAVPIKEIGGQIVELGSGFGGVAKGFAKLFPKAQVVGYEVSPFVYLTSRLFSFSQKNLTLVNRDFFQISLSSADLVICYLYPKAMERLEKKFREELKEGTWIVSNTFALPGWKPVALYQIADSWHTKIYLYQVTALK